MLMYDRQYNRRKGYCGYKNNYGYNWERIMVNGVELYEDKIKIK